MTHTLPKKPRMGIVTLMVASCVGLAVPVELDAHPARFHSDRALGVGHLTIEVAGADADVTFTALSTDVYGFSESPSLGDAKGLLIVEKIREDFRDFSKDLLRFPKELDCHFRAYVLGEFIGDHRIGAFEETPVESKVQESVIAAGVKTLAIVPKNDFMFRMAVHCASDLRGSEIKFGFATHFPRVHLLRVYLFEGINIKAIEVADERSGITP